MNLIILYFVLIAVMLIGVVGALLPAIPGVGLILAAILVWGFVTQFHGMALSLVVTLVILLLSLGVEILATYWGVKKFGASSWSQIGSIIGLIVGMLGLLPALPIGGPIVGILVGSILGGFIGEFAYRREMELIPRLQVASKVCLGIVVGSVVGNIIKALLALTAVIVFILTTWSTLPDFQGVSFDWSIIEQITDRLNNSLLPEAKEWLQAIAEQLGKLRLNNGIFEQAKEWLQGIT
ncbi:DUF456 domain-containing protein [Gloeocapsa sp. PCC 73106]|uniref:DUF456 domain-containing protein n=1 Tax=Gloeocapsa sp. PCC 73106 TaxID=102232 RepID=UPI0002AD00BD|nr:hypothetical protein GLO73106DRAFT_00011190 [Gloeocapsa sp. PCC 73106]